MAAPSETVPAKVPAEEAAGADVATTGSDVQAAPENVDEEQQGEALFPLTIVLPHDPKKIHVMVSPQEQVHELRQSIIELPSAFQYSCFHLEFAGERINDFVQISDIKDLAPEAEIKLVEDPYTEKEARIHVIRMRDLVGAAGDRIDTLHGVIPGTSLFDSVTEGTQDFDNAQSGAYEFASPAKPSILLPKEEEPAPKTVKSVALSAWNPPPYHYRQKGHLLYLIITTNEGEQYQITSHVGGFYVNKSSNSKFDPAPKNAPKGQAAHSLLTLLGHISPSFTESFEKLLQYNNRRDPLATFQMTNAIPNAPWLVPPPSSSLLAHNSDITRTQEGYLIAGVDNTDTLRDWNEEFQSARELPKETVQDRVFRERFISKLFADYTDAAARGAVLVARGEVTPLNPTEGRDAQIFVYNNVFFSFGADGVGTFASEGGDDAARVATGKDVNGVRIVNQLDIDGLYSPATVVVDYLGKRIVGQTVVPGIFKQREPGENSIDYGAVEGKDIVAADERFAPVFEKLSQALRVKKHAVWDKEGKRFDLEASVETKGLMGTDGRKYVLDLYRITPLDILWLEENDAADEKNEDAYPHRMTVLRPELVEAVRTQKWTAWVNAEVARIKAAKADPKEETKDTTKDDAAKESDEESEDDSDEDSEDESGDEAKSSKKKEVKDEEAQAGERIDTSNFSFALNPDAFSGQQPQTEEEKKEMAADEEDVRNACKYLRETAIPDFVNDVKSSDLPFPTDGQSLTKMLHRRGINLRYLGKVMSLCEGPRLTLLRSLCLQEVVARAFKHAASKYLRYLPVPLTSACIAHLLNCLLGSGLNRNPIPDIDESIKVLYPEADLAFTKVTPDSLREELELQAERRFDVELDDDWFSQLKHLQLLREVALKLGLQLQAKNFRFTSDIPASDSEKATPAPAPVNGTNGANGESKSSKKKKKAAAREGSPTAAAPAGPPHTFVADDIVNIVPIIKDSAPKSTISEEALEGGRHSIMQGNRKIGQELLLESLTLHEQIYGILHPEVARAYSNLAQIYYQLEEKEAAVDLARKATIVAERTIGVDSAETLLYYLNLSLFVHGSGDSKSALVYVKHALDLWKIIYGVDHPDSITTLNNAAVMLQHMQAYHESRIWFEEALGVCERVMGQSSLSSASLLFQLAQALALDGESKSALAKMRECYNIFREQLGPENNNTKEAETWLEQLTQNAVAIAKRDKDAQAKRLRAGIRFPSRQALGSSASQAQTGLDAKTKTGKTGPDSRSIDDLIKFIEGNDSQNKSTKKRAARGGPKTRLGAASS
ncbi:clustered mitochondria-domain-containing protein [Microdochium trichocladiopsis]|uniref:Clustered mitochondria protein homolog n=1 Tax=Microdochium trichocladiopsis TaxID=1682393 RepID=A0A9P8YHI2_9PEZI|nr:clustered mitochondria-domain-containing protein [Microdochium trichocladiopsis]KAH7038048.1 clustered mitochondria-domain-containing protein [Microdochium trichocladiopsis]